MSNHGSVLKLLGCYLETPIPTLVYEFLAMECLDDRIVPDTKGTHSQHLTWKTRLKISFEIANFISYLHTAFLITTRKPHILDTNSPEFHTF